MYEEVRDVAPDADSEPPSYSHHRHENGYIVSTRSPFFFFFGTHRSSTTIDKQGSRGALSVGQLPLP